MNVRIVMKLVIGLGLLLVPGAATAATGRPTRSAAPIAGRYIVVYHGSVSSSSKKTDKLERLLRFNSALRYGRALKGFSAKLSTAQVDRLRRDPQVAFVSPDRRVKALGTASLASGEPLPPTGIRRIGAATPTTAREASIANVAVIDTGLSLSHPDLNAVSGKNCVRPGTPAQDDNGHGTHVAGTISARNNGAGVVGVAPGTRVYAAKVLDSTGSGTSSQVICGIDWVTSTRKDADPANDIAVVNLSLGGTGSAVRSCSTTTDAEHKAICNSVAAGVIYVVAAGNDRWDFDYARAPDTPAAYPEVLTVTAMSDSDGQPGATGGAPACRTSEADDRYASFSNYAATSTGSNHTLAAPGVCIRSTWLSGGYSTISGTSMATPAVTGAVALCLGEAGARGPCAGLAPAQVVQRMRSDAASRTNATPSYGFRGDPLQPLSGRYFGYLTWVGTAGGSEDGTPPTISSVSPAENATAVPADASVQVAFSEAMDTSAAQSSFSLVKSGGGAVAGTFSWSGNTLVFQPSAPLHDGATYNGTVMGAGGSSPARDAAGNALASDKVWSFSTATASSGSPVTVAPRDTVIESGSLFGGSAVDLAADDDSFYSVASASTFPRASSWYGVFRGIPGSLSSLNASYKGKSSASSMAKSSANCNQTLSIWRWTTNSWVVLDSRSVGTAEMLVEKVPSGSPADYVSGGEARLRVQCSSSSSFMVSGDLLTLTYK